MPGALNNKTIPKIWQHPKAALGMPSFSQIIKTSILKFLLCNMLNSVRARDKPDRALAGQQMFLTESAINLSRVNPNM